MPEPVFIVATDLRPEDPAWGRVEVLAAKLQSFILRALGVPSRVTTAWLPSRPTEEWSEFQLCKVVDRIRDNASILFVLPTALDLNLWQRTLLGEELSEARRRHETLSIFHDTVDCCHPLLVDGYCRRVLQAIHERIVSPSRVGLLLVANGQSDVETRANAYRLMRTIWETAGLARAEVGFVRNDQPFLPDVLNGCLAKPLDWLLLPQRQWYDETYDYAQVMLRDHQRAHPESAAWSLLEPLQDDPTILDWLQQRVLRLWEENRAREAVRIRSAKYQEPPNPSGIWSGQDWRSPSESVHRPQAGLIGKARASVALADVLKSILPQSPRYLIKVTWHGYAQGTYTGPTALDLLLGALPGSAIVLEGHTSSRNVGGLDIEWETDAEQHRTWIRQQDLEFLHRTGLSKVLTQHKAQYFNLTEAWWDGACAPVEEVQAALGNVTLRNPDLAKYVPAALMDLRGTPLISFARFKGPTRLSISNLFGLIPHPLRTAWHGATISDFAEVCCDLAQLYGALFPLFGIVEAFETAVRWDRNGIYRSRWGNYDLVTTEGFFTASEGLVAADFLASRLQGQDVTRSAFFGVVRDRLGWPEESVQLPLPIEIQTSLV